MTSAHPTCLIPLYPSLLRFITTMIRSRTLVSCVFVVVALCLLLSVPVTKAEDHPPVFRTLEKTQLCLDTYAERGEHCEDTWMFEYSCTCSRSVKEGLRCSCEPDTLTGGGIAFIVAMVLIGVGVCLSCWYCLKRRRSRRGVLYEHQPGMNTPYSALPDHFGQL